MLTDPLANKNIDMIKYILQLLSGEIELIPT